MKRAKFWFHLQTAGRKDSEHEENNVCSEQQPLWLGNEAKAEMPKTVIL